MRQKSCNPQLQHGDSVLRDQACPKCGAEMEPIDIPVEGLPLEQLQLCPSCYLVMWSDHNGLHVRQGVPAKKADDLAPQTSWSAGELKEC